MVTILTPVEKDSSVTMDSGAKRDAVGHLFQFSL